jgi:ABC-type multidrug transport system fused ATPase/permease subunit
MNTTQVTSLALKTASTVLIISTIVDIAFTLLPYQLGDGKWWFAASAELVNRGLLPLVGIVFWLISDWIETVAKETSGRGNGLTKGITFLSILLGLLFFLIVPFQAWTSNADRDKTLTMSREEGTAMEAKIDKRVKEITGDKAKMQQVQQQIAEIDKAIKSGQLPGEELARAKASKDELEKLSGDPSKIKESAMGDLRRRQKDLEGAATANMWKTGIRASLASLLLSAGYSFIGLTGLRGQKR